MNILKCLLHVHMSSYFHMTRTQRASILIGTLLMTKLRPAWPDRSKRGHNEENTRESHITTGGDRWPGPRVSWTCDLSFPSLVAVSLCGPALFPSTPGWLPTGWGMGLLTSSELHVPLSSTITGRVHPFSAFPGHSLLGRCWIGYSLVVQSTVTTEGRVLVYWQRCIFHPPAFLGRRERVEVT